MTPPWKLTGLGVARYDEVPGFRGRGCAGCTTAALEIVRWTDGMASFEAGALAVVVGGGLTCFDSFEGDGCADGAGRSPLTFPFARQSLQVQGSCRRGSLGRALDVLLGRDCFWGLCGVDCDCFSASSGLLLPAARLSTLVSRVNVAEPALETSEESPLVGVAAVWLEYPESLASSRAISVSLILDMSGLERLAATLAV